MLDQRKEVAEGTTEVTFKLQTDYFTFTPGQYARIRIPSLDNISPDESTRDFTIITPPNTPSVIVIAFRNSESQFKKFLLEAPIGSAVDILAPLGVFVLKKGFSTPLVYIANGMGITPLLSYLRWMEYNKIVYQIQIVWVNSKIERAAYFSEIQQIAKINPTIKLSSVIGKLNPTMLKGHITFSNNAQWYLCGSPSLVQMMIEKIPLIFDVMRENIFTEEFPGYGQTLMDYHVYQSKHEPTEVRDMKELLKDPRMAEAMYDATSAGVLMALTDKEGTIEYVNDTFVQVSKYSKEELIGQNHRILKSGEHPPSVYKDLWDTISSGKVWKGQIKNRAKDGSFYWVNTTIVPIFDPEGQIEKYISMRLLITGQKEAEEMKKALLNLLDDLENEKTNFEELSKRSDLAISSANIGFFEWQPEKNSLQVNDEFLMILNLDLENKNLTMETFSEYFHPDIKEEVLHNLHEMKEAGKKLEMKIRVITATKEEKIVKLVAKAQSIKNSPSIKLMGVISDVTEQAKIDEIKTDFISLASHQLRTPLTAIKWYSDMLLKGDFGELQGEQKEIVSGLLDSTNRMTNLVNALLNISRIESGRLEINPVPTDLKKLVIDFVNSIKPNIETKKLNLKFEIAEDLGYISIDPKLIIEVYQNLINNAVQYTPNEGTITIQVTHNDAYVVTKISDTGYGIPIDAQKKIFERFFRADNVKIYVTEGTGLGLHLTKLLVEMSGGQISFESQENKGTTFTFTLPKLGTSPKPGSITLNN